MEAMIYIILFVIIIVALWGVVSVVWPLVVATFWIFVWGFGSGLFIALIAIFFLVWLFA